MINKNENIRFWKDNNKSYIFICDNIKLIGILMYNPNKKKWTFTDKKTLLDQSIFHKKTKIKLMRQNQ
jgi:hypothetical protein